MAKVLVTGTSAGIGLQTAIVMGRAGHTVYATMRNLERGVALRAVVEKERLPISILTMDVDSDESVDAATSAIRAQTGTIDALVNNAGIERTGSIEGLAFDDFKAAMETNYFGAIRTIRAWLPDMRTRRNGCIINVSSVAGRISCSPLTACAASKFALEAFSEGLAQEVKPFNVRVAIVQPGSSTQPWPDASSTQPRTPRIHRSAGSVTCSRRHSRRRRSRQWLPRRFGTSSKVAHRSSAIPSGPTQRRFLAGARR